jgi:hypothetical protein
MYGNGNGRGLGAAIFGTGAKPPAGAKPVGTVEVFGIQQPGQTGGQAPGGLKSAANVTLFPARPAVPHSDIVPNQRKWTTDPKTGLAYEIGTDSGGTTLAWFNGQTYGTPTTLPLNAGLRQALDKAAAAKPTIQPPPPGSQPSGPGVSVLPPPPVVGTLPPNLNVVPTDTGGGGGGGYVLPPTDPGIVPPDTPLGLHLDGKAVLVGLAVVGAVLWFAGQRRR